jgi:hypothetical protein
VRSKKKANILSREKVVVKSEAYGEHTRAPRGSKTRAVLNPAMKAHGRRLRKSNIPAKLIMDALYPYREDFKGGMLWQKLVKHFAAQAKKGEAYSVQGIGSWDLNNRYLTSRIMSPDVEVKPNKDFSNLKIEVNYTFSKRFLERKSNITAFLITLIFMFPDFKKNKLVTVPVFMPVKLMTDHSLYTFLVEIPRGANSYLVGFKAEACVDGVPEQNAKNVNKAMCLIASGMR